MPTPPVIADLVERFEQQGDAYKSGQYNEAQLRKEFIDPMFKALGWDMENVSGYAEAYKDVIHEDAIKIGGATKAPDYCFRIGGTQIDQLVYELYGLTNDEIKIVEAATNPHSAGHQS